MKIRTTFGREICSRTVEFYLAAQLHIEHGAFAIVEIETDLIHTQLLGKELTEISVQQEFAHSLLYEIGEAEIKPRHHSTIS